jgi:hypothetical protein
VKGRIFICINHWCGVFSVKENITSLILHFYPSIYLSVSLQLLWILAAFSVSKSIQSVGLLGRGISPSQGRYVHTEQHKQTSMTWVGLEPTIPVFLRAKTVHALDRAATVIGPLQQSPPHYSWELVEHHLHGMMPSYKIKFFFALLRGYAYFLRTNFL